MSPRRLAGWEPAQVTTFERDFWGRVIRTVTVQEPEFSRDDVATLLASRRRDALPRGSHGHLLSEATDPKNKWHTSLPTTDFAAKELNAAQERYSKTYPDADMSSLLWGVQKIDG